MVNRQKNKSAHPGIPDMTPSQLASAGLPVVRCTSKKKLTKDQQIAALQKELREAQELIASSVTTFIHCASTPTVLTFTDYLESFRQACRACWPFPSVTGHWW